MFNDLRVTSAVKSGRHFPRNVPSRSTFHSGEFALKKIDTFYNLIVLFKIPTSTTIIISIKIRTYLKNVHRLKKVLMKT